MNKFTDNDNGFGIFDKDIEPVKFLSFTDRTISTNSINSVIPDFKLIFTLSDSETILIRESYSLMMMVGDIGGFNGAIIIIPTFLMLFYSERMFKLAITSNIPVRQAKNHEAEHISATKRKFS